MRITKLLSLALLLASAALTTAASAADTVPAEVASAHDSAPAAAPTAASTTATSTTETAPARNRYAPYPRVTNITEGIAWPAGQALPTFATPAEALDTIEVQSLRTDEQLAFAALQGHVNKQQPRIYLLDVRADEGRDTWANTSTVALHTNPPYDRSNRYDLLAKYADEVTGIVLYDPSRNAHLRNLASTVAGLKRAIPVTSRMLARMQEHGIDLEVVEDLTSLTLDSPIAVYEYLYEHYWDQCTKRLIVSARPNERGGDHHHTRDIAAACGAAVVWLDGRIPAERDLLRKFFADMQAGNAIALGWYATERSGITTASEFGIGTMPADYYMSGSVLSGTDHRIQIPAVPKRRTLENKLYVALFISDGDNIQYNQHAMRRLWDSSARTRGKLALNWTIAPGLVDAGPGIMNYYYSTATPNDCFATGPSGMGYMMPCNTLTEPGAPVDVYTTDPQDMDGYARLTETYLQRSGLRVATIWDNATPMQRSAYERRCRQLYGATVQNFKDDPSVKGSVVGDRLRFDKLTIPYCSSYQHLHSSLSKELRRWDGESPKFLSYQVNVWNELRPRRIAELYADLQDKFPDQLQFVRADHYFNLYNEAHGLPWNLAMAARTAVTDRRASDIAALVADGTPTTLWTSPASGDSPWLAFDFGESYQIHRYVIRHAGDHGLAPDENTRDFTVEGSQDGKTWQTLDAYRGNAENVTDVDLSPTAARYVRILIDKPGADGTARIADVEIYGSAP